MYTAEVGSPVSGLACTRAWVRVALRSVSSRLAPLSRWSGPKTKEPLIIAALATGEGLVAPIGSESFLKKRKKKREGRR